MAAGVTVRLERDPRDLPRRSEAVVVAVTLPVAGWATAAVVSHVRRSQPGAMIVAQSGNARAGRWVEESRDIEADFRAAFAWKGPAPRVNGVLVSSDTDQTGERAAAWFGDLRLEARR